jgi:hypothetical protein
VKSEEMFIEHILPLVPIFINNLYYKSEELLYVNEKALEFFLSLGESVQTLSIDSGERAKRNFEMIAEHGLISALMELVQNAD